MCVCVFELVSFKILTLWLGRKKMIIYFGVCVYVRVCACMNHVDCVCVCVCVFELVSFKI